MSPTYFSETKHTKRSETTFLVVPFSKLSNLAYCRYGNYVSVNAGSQGSWVVALHTLVGLNSQLLYPRYSAAVSVDAFCIQT